MLKTQTSLWVIVFFIAVVFFILLCQSSNKSAYGGLGGANGDEPALTLFVKPVDTQAIAVDIPASATTEDLIQQVQAQLGRRINPLSLHGILLQRGEPLADQGVSAESLINEEMVREDIKEDRIIKFDFPHYLVRKDHLNTAEGIVTLLVINNYEGASVGRLQIPLDCLKSSASRRKQHLRESLSDLPRRLEIKGDCDMSQIIILSLNPSLDPNSISNIEFGPPFLIQGWRRSYKALGIK